MAHPRTWSPSRSCAGFAAALALAITLIFLAATANAGEREIPPPRIRAWQTGLLRTDRLRHLSLAWTLGLGVGVATGSPLAATAAPATLGLAKEIADRPRFDRVDLLADLLGAAAAGWVTTRARF